MRISTTATLAAALLLCSPASAQTLTLGKSGGAAPGTTTLSLQGSAGEIYAVLFSPTEAATVAPSGALLEIPLDYLWLTFAQPGFVGLLNGTGKASPSFTLSNDPSLIGQTFSFQALQGPAFTVVSNLVRVTPAAPGTFTPTLDAPDLPIVGGAVAKSADGTLQLVGGSGPVAQSYSPNREEFELGGTTFGVGILSQATALADGRILFTGGLGTDGAPTTAAAVYDPLAGTTTTLALNAPRAGHGASLLGNGKVLISGGFAAFDLTDILSFLTGVQASTELYDPTTNTFSAGPNMLEARALHTSTALNNGGALVAGGLSIIPILNLPNVSATAYEYSAALNSFGLPKLMSTGRLAHSAVKLANGKVLIAGGATLDFAEALATGDLTKLKVGTLTDCQVYTSGFFGSFASAGALSIGRAAAGIAALPGGGAVIAGGLQVSLDLSNPTGFAFTPLANADRYDGTSVSATGSMSAARLLPVLEPLNDGTILVLGGGATSAETYQP
jgi:hypothetical protein